MADIGHQVHAIASTSPALLGSPSAGVVIVDIPKYEGRQERPLFWRVSWNKRRIGEQVEHSSEKGRCNDNGVSYDRNTIY